MRKKILPGLLICILLLSTLFITSCGEDDDQTEIDNPVSITISITYPADAKISSIAGQEFSVEEDSTVLDAIQLYCNVNGLPIMIETTNSDIVAINNVENNQYKDNAKWQCKVNDKVQSIPLNEVALKEGDKLEFIYQK